MIGFFYEDKDSKSMSRLCMFLGTTGGIFYALINKTPDWSIIAALMIGGCFPYIFNKINETKNQLIDDPKRLQSFFDVIKGLKNV